MHNWGFMPAHPSVYVRREVFAKFGYYKLGYKISAVTFDVWGLTGGVVDSF